VNLNSSKIERVIFFWLNENHNPQKNKGGSTTKETPLENGQGRVNHKIHNASVNEMRMKNEIIRRENLKEIDVTRSKGTTIN